MATHQLVIKCCIENNSNFSDILQVLGNELLKSEKYPKLWKTDLIRPIHKKESTSKESNYRGITLSSCFGKFFNAMILNRILKAFEELNISHHHLMGFRPNMRTSNNILILKTLIDKQFNNNQKLYFCFVDFSKAFDTVWRKGLLSKLRSYGIEGKMLNVLHSLYTDTTVHVKINNYMSEAFDILLGVKQGDPPSPFFFNIYMNDLSSDLINSANDSETHKLQEIYLPCLFWADDLVLLSKTKDGLQKQPDILAKYSSDWKLKVNIDKTKSLIFNKSGRLIKTEKVCYKGYMIEPTKHYKYLGILSDSNGKFKSAMDDLAKKGMRASHSIYKLSTCNSISHKTLIETFNSLFKPIVLFSSEIWGYEIKPDCTTEKSLLRFCKHILGVSRTSVNNAVLGELRAFPLSEESNTALITYYLYLKNHKNRLIASIIPEMKSLNNDWHKYINSVIETYLPNYEIQKYAYSYKTPDPNSTKNNKLTQHSLKKTLQEKIKQNFIDKWLRNISECNKLEFYSDIKSKFKIEPYLNLVENRSHKNALTRL